MLRAPRGVKEMLNKDREPTKTSVAIHLAMGLMFTGMSVFVLAICGMALLESGGSSGGTNRWGYRDNMSPIAFGSLFFIGFAWFSWMGFAEDLKFLRKKHAEAPNKTKLSSPDPTHHHRKGRRSRRS